MEEDRQPVTRSEFQAELATQKAEILEAVQEMVRDAQTELLRGFARYSESEVIRLR